MTDLVLYHRVPSRSMTVHWLLEELGEPFELRMLDFESSEHKTPEYLSLNPMGRVPTLLHGDTIVTETPAICAYLADAFPGAGLGAPPDAAARADYFRWLFFASVSAEPSILWQALGCRAEADDYEPFAAVGDIADALVTAVRDKEYVAGGCFTVADIMIGSTVMWGTQLMPVLPEREELIDYWERLSQRPAWQRASAKDQTLMA